MFSRANAATLLLGHPLNGTSRAARRKQYGRLWSCRKEPKVSKGDWWEHTSVTETHRKVNVSKLCCILYLISNECYECWKNSVATLAQLNIAMQPTTKITLPMELITLFPWSFHYHVVCSDFISHIHVYKVSFIIDNFCPFINDEMMTHFLNVCWIKYCTWQG